MVLSEINALISAPVISAAKADPIRPTTPLVIMVAHATKRMILFPLLKTRTLPIERSCLTAFRLGTSPSCHTTELGQTQLSPAEIRGCTSAHAATQHILFCFGSKCEELMLSTTSPVYSESRHQSREQGGPREIQHSRSRSF